MDPLPPIAGATLRAAIGCTKGFGRSPAWCVVAGVLLAAPALAQPLDIPALAQLTPGLSSADPAVQVPAAIAACILGNGDLDATVAQFTGAGWTHNFDDEMGLHDLTAGPDQGAYVMLGDQGFFCDVFSPVYGTADMKVGMEGLLALTPTGLVPSNNPDTDGCPAYTLPGGGTATVQSGGQDPVCDSNDSAVRMYFAPAN